MGSRAGGRTMSKLNVFSAKLFDYEKIIQRSSWFQRRKKRILHEHLHLLVHHLGHLVLHGLHHGLHLDHHGLQQMLRILQAIRLEERL
jgi:hypothetical protein